jgi:ABC-2 type transport system permease protein
MWALVGVCMSFAISIVHERLIGTFLRLRLAPISRSQILLGKGLGAFLAALGATTLLLLFAAVVFHVRMENPRELAAAILAASFCFVGLMMLIAVLGRTHQAVAGAGWAILLVMSMTGGGMIPLIAMPAWMQTVSNFSLVKWGVLALEGAIWRGFSWGEMALPLGILVGTGAAAFLIGATLLSRSET